MSGHSPLPVIQAGGFSASVDAYAWEPDPDPSAHRTWLWFLSLLGPQQAVKALWARLVKGETVTLSQESAGHVHFCRLAPEGLRGWRFLTASLPAAAGYHGVLVPEVALYTTERTEFLLLPRTRDEAARLHHRFLNRRIDLPLHPGWADWLWQRARGTGEAAPLEAYGVEAYRCTPDVEALAADLSDGVRRRLLPLLS